MNSNDEPKELAIPEPKRVDITPSNLQKMVDVESKKRAILTKFITDHMKDGVDYGKIHINKACTNKYECKNAYHFSKPSLFKPGSEKFLSLMKLRPQYQKDSDTWEMAGSPAGMFCYICFLVDMKGNIVGEGRGCATIDEKSNANTAVKIAEKRAKIDAVLSTGGLSDFFTQDLEDMEIANAQTTNSQNNKDAKPFPMTQKQRNFIMGLLKQKGKSNDSLDSTCETLFKTEFDNLSADQASTIIERLTKLPDKSDEVDSVDPDDIPDNLGEEE